MKEMKNEYQSMPTSKLYDIAKRSYGINLRDFPDTTALIDKMISIEMENSYK